MPNQTCAQLIRCEAVRALQLDDVGAIDPGASSEYDHAAPILFQYEPQIPTRDRFEQVNGNGDTCALFVGPPRAVDSTNLTMNLCTLDAELLEMLCGGTLITDGSYGTIGYLGTTDDTVAENGVSVETWSIAWNGRQRSTRSGQAAHWRHVFPLSRWQQGQLQMQNGFSVVPVTGVGEPNSGFGTGLDSDPWPVDVGDAPYGYFLDPTVIDGHCGFVAVP